MSNRVALDGADAPDPESPSDSAVGGEQPAIPATATARTARQPFLVDRFIST
jgi:hypothetical protein